MAVAYLFWDKNNRRHIYKATSCRMMVLAEYYELEAVWRIKPVVSFQKAL